MKFVRAEFMKARENLKIKKVCDAFRGIFYLQGILKCLAF